MLHQADKLSGAVPMALDAGVPKDLDVENSNTTRVQELPTREVLYWNAPFKRGL